MSGSMFDFTQLPAGGFGLDGTGPALGSLGSASGFSATPDGMPAPDAFDLEKLSYGAFDAKEKADRDKMLMQLAGQFGQGLTRQAQRPAAAAAPSISAAAGGIHRPALTELPTLGGGPMQNLLGSPMQGVALSAAQRMLQRRGMGG